MGPRAATLSLLAVAALPALVSLVPEGATGEEGDATRDLLAARSLERRIQQVVAQVSSAVVTVGVPAEEPANRADLRSGGSGVMIRADGYILTCDHVTEGLQRVLVGLPDGRTLDAEVVGRDVLGDVAVLKAPVQGQPCVALGPSEELQVGDWVLAMGNPFGLARGDHTPAATLGIVSALHRYQGGTKVYGDALQIDAAVNPGSSGGPLFDLRGRLVGLNGRISVRGLARHNVGVGFAIPSHQIRLVLDDLLAGRDVNRGYLGVRFLTQGDGQPGVVVSEVLPSSPAAEAGLRRGDRILAVGERELDHPVRLQNYLSVLPAGARVSLHVLRAGSRITLEVTLGSRGEGAR